MINFNGIGAFHYAGDAPVVVSGRWTQVRQFTYTFQNYFHPLVGDMISALNQNGLDGLFCPTFQATSQPFFTSDYTLLNNTTVQVNSLPQGVRCHKRRALRQLFIWEILFHIPVMVRRHLSNNHASPRATDWFHYVFDRPAPTRVCRRRRGAGSSWRSGRKADGGIDSLSSFSRLPTVNLPRRSSSSSRRSRTVMPRCSTSRSVRTSSLAPDFGISVLRRDEIPR